MSAAANLSICSRRGIAWSDAMPVCVVVRTDAVCAPKMLTQCCKPVSTLMAQHPKFVRVDDAVLPVAGNITLDWFAMARKSTAPIQTALVFAAELTASECLVRASVGNAEHRVMVARRVLSVVADMLMVTGIVDAIRSTTGGSPCSTESANADRTTG